jgi:hypothetical protein
MQKGLNWRWAGIYFLGLSVAMERNPELWITFHCYWEPKTMRKSYSRLKLEELDPTTHDIRPLTLTGMFVAQSARECVEFVPRVFELPKELQRRLRLAGELEGAELDEETLTQHRRA